MATKPSSALSLPWLWVIEALASFKQVEPPLLIDLVKRTPESSGDVGKDAREMVSLKLLERLSSQGTGITNDVDSASHTKIGFDPSERCEDVLLHIFDQTSESSLKTAGPEMQKWDTQSFVVHKKSSSPKCTLQKLKEAILSGSHGQIESLKERSGLAPRIQSKDSLSSENGNDQLQENPSNKTSLPAKRPRDESTNKDLQIHEEQIAINNSSIPCSSTSKKLKHGNASSSKEAIVENLVSVRQTDLVNDSSERIQHVEGQGCGLSTEPVAGESEDNRFLEDRPDKQRLVQNGDAELLHNLENIPSTGYSGGQIKQNICGAEDKEDGEGLLDIGTSQQRNSVDEATVGCGNSIRENCDAEAKEDGEGLLDIVISKEKNSVDEARVDCENSIRENGTNPNVALSEKAKAKANTNRDNTESDMYSDSDSYHEERNDIVTKKHAFLSSQPTYSQDSLATTNFSELSLCMKCNKGGQLLVCSSNSCPIVVHHSCLGSSSSFDGNGSFYCPFCAYSRAISEYLEAKRKTSLARNDLAAFIGLKVDHQPKKISKRRPRSEENKEDQQPEPSVSRANDNPPHGRDKEVEKTGQKRQSPRGMKEKEVSIQAVSKEIIVRNEKIVDPLPVVNFAYERLPVSGSKAEGSSDEENNKPLASVYSIRVRKQEAQCTSPAFPQLRRKKVPWTKVEEETLKEGVRRFTSANDRSIPWKMILEFGVDVFFKGRTTIDLKDKWRNICKGGGSPMPR